MLLELSIRHIALIDELSIELAPGLNVLTGETGAGKSIVVGAVNFVLGDRADRDLLQSGAKRGSVEALFDVSNHAEALALLAEMGIAMDEGQLSIARDITDAGRSVCRIAGVIVPLQTLKRMTSLLVDLHGQHAHQSLLDVRRHLEYLDAFGGEKHLAHVRSVRALYDAWHAASRELSKAHGDAQESERRLDMLQFQLKELDEANLVDGEEKALEEQRERARHAGKINEALDKCYALTVQGAGRGLGALDALRAGASALSAIAGFGDAYAELQSRIEEISYTLEDVAGELSGLREEMEDDPRRIDAVEDRLDLIQRLRRKYGATTGDMLAYRERVAEELTEMEDSDARIERLEKEEKARRKALQAEAEALSTARAALAKDFEKRLLAQLADLGMAHSRFEVHFAVEDRELRAHGLDAVEFLIAPNPGEPLKALARIASGGEMARIMLAIKSIAADCANIPVMIFDEIDTGISGRMAQVVAEKMAAIGQSRQVICVTHLPQITAMADTHYIVAKKTDGQVTRTHVHALDEAGRRQALAYMLGGADPGSDSSLRHAQALLEDARNLKNTQKLHA